MLDRRRRVWRRGGERYANCAIVEHDRYGGGSLMVRGGISVRSRTELLVLNGTLTGQRYINEVLQPVVLPFVQQHHVVLQDDKARPHRARKYNSFCSRTLWIISIGLLDPLTCRQSTMFGTFSTSVYDREFHDQERSKLWAQPCRRSGGGYPNYILPDSPGVCVVVVWPA